MLVQQSVELPVIFVLSSINTIFSVRYNFYDIHSHIYLKKAFDFMNWIRSPNLRLSVYLAVDSAFKLGFISSIIFFQGDWLVILSLK